MKRINFINTNYSNNLEVEQEFSRPNFKRSNRARVLSTSELPLQPTEYKQSPLKTIVDVFLTFISLLVYAISCLFVDKEDPNNFFQRNFNKSVENGYVLTAKFWAFCGAEI